jgi:cobaltochelatase CobS
MPTANLDEIRGQARRIAAAQPRLSTGAYVSAALRSELTELAELAGIPLRVACELNDNDLLSVYLVACKDAKAATAVAERICLRAGKPTTFDPFAPREPREPVEPKSPRMPPVPREPSPTPTQIDADAIRALIKAEIQEGVLAPVQSALDGLGERIDAVPADATQRAINALREVVAEEAHKAASDALKNMQPTRLDVVIDKAPAPVSLGLVHRETPKIISALAAGVNVYLHGPAGSGKTTVARKAAEAFGIPFHFAAKVESEYQLLGFKDAKGDTVRTPFREAYEHGGQFLFDEMDASSPSAVVALNAALANGICPFPDDVIQRHPDFRCIGAGNTKLTGATRAYAGRNQLDAASIDRFVFIEFGYDDDLERAIASDARWCEYVQAVRAAVAERGLNHLVTPRATYDGCALLAAGFDWETVAAMVVYKGLDADTVRQIEAAVPRTVKGR